MWNLVSSKDEEIDDLLSDAHAFAQKKIASRYPMFRLSNQVQNCFMD
jgi:hypothetical protein